ncbi:hypothetical protein [Proteiniborus sp. MB09-C3]|uniref:hypothetical protein n=1 Tax=Proteiniborus sp. MB09-C3 TaxID=3050072 RepID=UPI002553B708|nr:hypothetical protein [Proteiniborus sp. MB09-C3]WIV13669.1 hypothetical protein QO263_08215 [Proteiniborus sp. MB09-C3]
MDYVTAKDKAKEWGISLRRVQTFCETNRIEGVINIGKEDRFKGDNIEWIFYLVGNKFNSEISGEIENAKSHGERSLAYNVNRKKIYVKTWSEIFTEQEINYNFLQEKLMLQQEIFIKRSRNKTANEIATKQKDNTAIRPKEIVI